MSEKEKEPVEERIEKSIPIQENKEENLSKQQPKKPFIPERSEAPSNFDEDS